MSRANAANEKRKRELARIHILKAELKLDRESYENVLYTLARVTSAAMLDEHGRDQVINHMEGLQARAKGVRPAYPGKPATADQRPLLRKIEAQLTVAKRPWSYAVALATRMYGKERLEFCTDTELSGIVAALALDAGRRKKPDLSPPERAE